VGGIDIFYFIKNYLKFLISFFPKTLFFLNEKIY